MGVRLRLNISVVYEIIKIKFKTCKVTMFTIMKYAAFNRGRDSH